MWLSITVVPAWNQFQISIRERNMLSECLCVFFFRTFRSVYKTLLDIIILIKLCENWEAKGVRVELAKSSKVFSINACDTFFDIREILLYNVNLVIFKLIKAHF